MTDDPKEPTGDAPESSDGGGGRGGVKTAFQFFQRFAKLWGFLAFILLILVLARHVVLPFVFALLLAYILAPIVRRLSVTKDGAKRMPRGAAIVLCYIVFLAVVGSFMFAMLPRLSKDVARIGAEAPSLYRKLNDQWAPQMARWLEHKFPSLAAPVMVEEAPPVVADVPLPPGTQFLVTPLPDGRFAIQLEKTGLTVTPRTGGGITVAPAEEKPEAQTLEDRLRAFARDGLSSMQSQLGDVFRFGRRLVSALLKSVFTFFLVLMIAAFILLDLGKIHSFARGLVPEVYRNDYDVIVAGIDRGLSGVIRGQLTICVVNGILTYIGLVIFGVKYSLLLAIVASVLSLIPIFGSILSTIPIVLAALVSTDVGVDMVKPIIMVGWIAGIHLLEANLLNPKIIGTAAKIHPVLVIFALVLGEHSYGLTGALLAVPVASIVQVLFLYFRHKAWRTAQSGSTATTTS